MVLGQSSATAAVMAIDKGTSVQRIDVAALQSQLKDDPLADGTLFEILTDNADTLQVQRKGRWNVQQQGGYGPDFLAHEPAKEGAASVRFTPEIPERGSYQGYIYFPKVDNISDQTMVIVYDGERNYGMSIKDSDIRVEGQTSGEWVPLGTYTLPAGKRSYVQVSSKDSNGKVVADAVIWVPAQAGK